MKVIGLANCGTDMVVKFLPSGDPVGEVSLAFRLSRKDKETGKYATTWIKAAMFGKRAESLSQYITKGSSHVFYLKDLMADEFTGKDGDKRTTLKAIIEDVELAGSKNTVSTSAPKPERQPGDDSFDTMADDIPF